MITRQTIDAIFNAARVEEVIGDFVQLKKSGSNFKGLSPFSNEKTPSFMVSPAKQIWKDFSSGKGGNVVSFLMEHEQFTYPEALRWLAKRYNIEIEEDKERTEEQLAEAKSRENLYTLTEFANKYYQDQLLNTDEGKAIGYSYFKERGFSKAIIEKFQLGYSPKKANAFTSYALSKGYSYKVLEEAGFTVGSEENPVDRFRERVMFPIQSFSGRTLGFGGRILDNTKKFAKYLNSPENEIYHKSKILYGVYQSKSAILKKDECLLVEGYTDVISLHQNGIENVVASSGTALTPDQIRLIKRLTHNLTLLYDGDAAGVKASFRGIDLILEQELNAKIVLLPEGEDPDSFAQKHSASEVEDFIKENATDFIRFKIKVLQQEAKDDPVKQSEMVQSVVDSIALIPNLLQREIYVRDAASMLNMREESLFRQLAIVLQKKEKEIRKNATVTNAPTLKEIQHEREQIQTNPFLLLEEELIKTMLQYGDEKIVIPDEENPELEYESTVIEEIISHLLEDDIRLTTPFYQEMFTEIAKGLEQEELRTGQFFIQLMDEELSAKASDLMFDKYKLSNWEKHGTYVPTIKENLEKDINEMVLNYKRLVIKEMILLEQNKFKKSDEDITEKRTEVINEIMRLTEIKNRLESLLNRVV